jgi:hypothetical protein
MLPLSFATLLGLTLQLLGRAASSLFGECWPRQAESGLGQSRHFSVSRRRSALAPIADIPFAAATGALGQQRSFPVASAWNRA